MIKKPKLAVTAIVMIALLLALTTACGKRVETPAAEGTSTSSSGNGGAASSSPSAEPTPTPSPSSTDPLDNPNHSDQNPVVTIEMSTGKTITVELYPKVAPNTVNNFISLVKKGFYDGLIFHRVIPDFMIQGGDPEGTGMGGPGYGIKGEFSTNKFTNDLKHTRGVISMARSQSPDSAGSQFFIMVADSPFLDGQYAAFGQVLEGMDVADEIVRQNTADQDRPLDPMSMTKVTVDTKGVDYPEPETIK
ncbi:peptidylprolyl isomerase [Cohnella faecalis]|uniref:Peptidyl-prolyl cis-trans isomerase n=1 Tax=Cohnella faecalis TaxID=2315694 RepID=A0A398CR06_9BACL|nr:peptidylprolyl isomerase [Cohnella faecalis]RIE01861.1 peptidylprolyl isomerase [Cohnella faecalis]